MKGIGWDRCKSGLLIKQVGVLSYHPVSGLSSIFHSFCGFGNVEQVVVCSFVLFQLTLSSLSAALGLLQKGHRFVIFIFGEFLALEYFVCPL